MLIRAISENLDELFEDCSLAAVATLGELRRVMVVAKDLPIMLIIAVLCAKDSRAY